MRSNGAARGLFVVAVAVMLALVGGAGVATAAEQKYEGKVLGCKYVLTADTSGHELSASISECKGTLEPEGELEASWQDKQPSEEEVEKGTALQTTTFELGTATLSLLGESRKFELDLTLTLPVNVDYLIALYEKAKKLQAEGKKTVKEVEEAKAQVQKQIEAAITGFESDLIGAAAGALATVAGSGVPDQLGHFLDKANALEQTCEPGTDYTIPWCSPYIPEPPPCLSSCPVPAKGRDGNLGETQGDDAEESEQDQEQLCPVINKVEPDVVFVCVPSTVVGTLDTGKKPLVIIGGGALLMIPDQNGEAKISSEKAIVQLGGAIVGDDLELEAPDIAMAGGFLNAIGELEMQGDRISIGQVDGETLLGAIPSLPRDWAPEIVEEKALHAKIKFPDIVSARETTIKAKDAFALGAGSTILGAGLGGHGGEFASGIDPTGESEEFGGSHGGLGGYTTSFMGIQAYDFWNTMEGRAPVYGDPFKPTEKGDGGGGKAGDALGLSGGGTIAIQAPEADVTVNGKIDMSGFGTGLQDATSNGDHGGSGAGGSVYLTAETFAGNGTIDANGGSHCAEKISVLECSSGSGGSGGGGRIAALFESDPAWSGQLEARGGVDQNFTDPEEGFLGTGGAGTVFTRSVEFDDKGAVEKGTGAFPEGTLTVDGGRTPGAYPPPDGTPLQDSWSSPQRRLVIENEGRAYGHELHFGEIDVQNGGVLTTGISTAKAAIPQTLSLTAETLKVDASSEVTMAGRGYAGGGESEAGRAAAAPGQSGSTERHGGSHGGTGGSGGADEPPGRVSGSTYDSSEDPVLPGGGGAGEEAGTTGTPGGGVLDVSVQKLELDGLLSADGLSGDGPTALEAVPFDITGGAGAGGSVDVHAATIAGTGKITALGGTSCIDSRPPLLVGANGCGLGSGASGGGGGGRVALHATAACSWSGGLSAAGGVDSQSELHAEVQDALARRGSAGSVFFPVPPSACPKEEPKSEPPKSEEAKKPPPPPSFKFRIVSRRTSVKSGAEALVVAVPGAGTLSAVETAKLPVKHRRAKVTAISHTHANPASASFVKLTLPLSKAARAYLKKHHVLRITIRVAFTPHGGKAATLKTEFVLRRALR